MFSHNAKIRDKGQITIPSGMRKEYDLQIGDVVSFEAHPDGILIRRPEDIVAKLSGIFASQNKGELLTWTRDEVWEGISNEREVKRSAEEVVNDSH